ncbi:hypothetical protein [Caldisericum sp.]
MKKGENPRKNSFKISPCGNKRSEISLEIGSDALEQGQGSGDKER